MLAINLYFTAGRYSATPWGRQVNEGLTEWPPSPWRLLRALVAVWRRALPEAPQAAVADLLHRLTPPPQYHLPVAGEGHSRHYMPVVEGGREARTLIFDAFVTVPRDVPVVIQWPELELSPDARSLLGALLERLPHLGRAESWCRAMVASEIMSPLEFRCRPLAAGATDRLAGDMDLVSVLAADADLPPAGLLDRLQVDTARLRQERRDPYRPPGSRWVTYLRPREALASLPARAPSQGRRAPDSGRAAAEPRVYVARYAISGAVRPQVLRTIDVAEAARRALMSRDGWSDAAGMRTLPSERFSGKDAAGRPLRGHRHAFYLPADEDGDGFLDHLNVCLRSAADQAREAEAAPGFMPREARALEGLSFLRGVTQEPLQLVLLHLGELRPSLRLGGALGHGSVWESCTPYMLPRHPKPLRDGSGWKSDGPEQQLRRELAERFGEEIAAGAQVEPLPTYCRNGQTWSWQAFRRSRLGRNQPPPYPVGLGARIILPAPVGGPVALGYACHFGLGQFRVVEGAS